MIITIILAEGMDEGLRLIHFLTLIVKCSETRCWIYHSGTTRIPGWRDCVSERHHDIVESNRPRPCSILRHFAVLFSRP